MPMVRELAHLGQRAKNGWPYHSAWPPITLTPLSYENAEPNFQQGRKIFPPRRSLITSRFCCEFSVPPEISSKGMGFAFRKAHLRENTSPQLGLTSHGWNSSLGPLKIHPIVRIRPQLTGLSQEPIKQVRTEVGLGHAPGLSTVQSPCEHRRRQQSESPALCPWGMPWSDLQDLATGQGGT